MKPRPGFELMFKANSLKYVGVAIGRMEGDNPTDLPLTPEEEMESLTSQGLVDLVQLSDPEMQSATISRPEIFKDQSTSLVDAEDSLYNALDGLQNAREPIEEDMHDIIAHIEEAWWSVQDQIRENQQSGGE